ncbi:MAG: DNA translocase FtsK [Oscillospiraceae bacterium]|nr:DNA translocase FtsK [Oscillospiraceae bacterium]
MAVKKNTRNTNKNQQAAKEKQSRQLWAVVMFGIGFLLTFLTLVKGVAVWRFFHNQLFGMFGIAAYFFGPVIITLSIMASREVSVHTIKTKLWQAIALTITVCGALHIFYNPDLGGGGFLDKLIILHTTGTELKSGGVAGSLLGWSLSAAFGSIGAGVTVFIILFVLIMLVTETTLFSIFRWIKNIAGRLRVGYEDDDEDDEDEDDEKSRKFDIDIPFDQPTRYPMLSKNIDIPIDQYPDNSKERAANKTEYDELAKKAVTGNAKPDKQTEDQLNKAARESGAGRYTYPPAELLKKAKHTSNTDASEELRANAARLVDTLKSFGVQTRIVDISRGPSVTRYELQPSAGVKISKITGLADDIALNLAAAGVRIEAPIPNKAAVGIEVPNKNVDIVTLREIIDSAKFDSEKSRVAVALGRDIAGNAVTADLAGMPHVLIAGSTGSGKSVCINSIIISLLYKSSPDDVRLLMIDPKVVELGVYNGIPHLLVPVVTDPHKAAGALGWAVTEMLNRYKLFADNGVRDIKGYNKAAEKDDELSKLPQIVIFIDELADLMMVAPNEVEDNICRLAQMARAAGMHLVIATQRPSVDVITGIIKANIPSRIAFAVTSQIDSRTILDGGGAEKLLGKGDMLFYPVGYPKPVRVQGCYVSDKEVEEVIAYIKRKDKADYKDEIMDEIEKQAVVEKSSKRGSAAADESEDDMMFKAIECVIDAGQASTSYLQRKLKLGYARAARLMDEMAERGIVGESEGSKPRQVLMTRAQFLEMKMNQDEE